VTGERPKVYCSSCDFVSHETRKLDPTKWTCVRAPRYGVEGVVDEGWLFANPYQLCSRIQYVFSGRCPLYRPRLPGQKSLHLEEQDNAA